MWTEVMSFLAESSALEIIATISFVLYVILATREHPLCWPVSMVGVSIMVYISFDKQLYLDIFLNAYYFFISIYGIYNWIKGGKNDTELPVTMSSPKELLVMALIAVTGILVLGYAVDNISHNVDWLIPSDVAYWDAATTVLSLIGTWMLTQKKIGNWLIWIVVDSIYIWLYAYKGLTFLSGLNVFFVVISFYGLYEWYQSMQKSRVT